MRAYVGKPNGSKMLLKLWSQGLGQVVARGELPPTCSPWFYDNGAFRDWKAGKPFDEAAFTSDVTLIALAQWKPDFIVLPDVVAGGLKSLHHSLRWVPMLRGAAPLYLAVQDGMTPADVRPVVPDGLFVGGSLKWKIRTAPEWVKLAHQAGVPCHVGRCGTARRVAWAKRIGADSIDSSLPLWSSEKLQVFLSAMGHDDKQFELGA